MVQQHWDWGMQTASWSKRMTDAIELLHWPSWIGLQRVPRSTALDWHRARERTHPALLRRIPGNFVPKTPNAKNDRTQYLSFNVSDVKTMAISITAGLRIALGRLGAWETPLFRTENDAVASILGGDKFTLVCCWHKQPLHPVRHAGEETRLNPSHKIYLTKQHWLTVLLSCTVLNCTDW